MLAREVNVELLEQQELNMNVLLGPNIDKKKFSSYAKTVNHNLAQYAQQKLYHIKPIQSQDDALASSMSGMIKAWYKLEEMGVLDQWEKEMSANAAEVEGQV